MPTAKKKEGATNYERYHIPNLKRALDVFELLAKDNSGLTLSEISSATKYSKNSIFRIVCTLQDCGYVVKDPTGRKIMMSRKLAALGYAGFGETDIVEKSMDVIRAMRDKFGETAMLGTLLKDECVMIEQAPGRFPFKFLGEIGMRISVQVSAPGKAILAYLPKEEQEARLEKMKFQKFTENTIVNKRNYFKELDDVRKKGYACDRAEEIAGVHCIGAPVFNAHGYPVASVWITGPSSRLPLERLDEVGVEIRAFADKISSRLGYNLF
ncbi:MAG: IclR family transcriptional regulator [Opitutales bacterium]|nr:IclR family transcriptional regulator [Opitutales bacterium]